MVSERWWTGLREETQPIPVLLIRHKRVRLPSDSLEQVSYHIFIDVIYAFSPRCVN